MSVSKLEVLRLYKNLLTYSKTLNLTDPAFFRRRIAAEFRRNKVLSNPEDITFAYQENHYFDGVRWSKMLWGPGRRLHSQLLVNYTRVALKHTVDLSKVPVINECDLSEQFVRGSGPGGSAVNKNANCVVLTHIPTGTVVKCHISRCQDENRKLARAMLVERLDEEINGEHSVAAQKKRLEEMKYKKTEAKKKKRAQLKSEWKKREGIE